MDHEVFEPRIFVSHRLDAVDDMARRAAEPRLLRNAVAQRRHAGRRSGRAPGAPVLVGVAHEPEWRKPLEAFVVRRLEPADGFLLGVGKVYAGSPDHVFAELFAAALPFACVVIGTHDVVQNLLSVERDHRLEPVARHELDRLAAGDRHPDVDRQMLGPGYHGNVLEAVAAIFDRWWTFVVFALVMEGIFVETLEKEFELLLEQFAIGLRVEERCAERFYLAR